MEMVNKLKGYRTMAGFTQADMAEKLGMTTRTYCAKESCIDSFSLGEAKKIIQLLNTKGLDLNLEDLD